MNKIFFISIFFLMLIINIISASDILVWQGQYYSGTTFNTGTYEFNFSVYDSSTGGEICYSNLTTLTTGNFGEWKTEQSGVSSACNNVSKDYFLNINIDGVDQIPRRRLITWNFLRKDVDEITSGKLQTDSEIIAPVIHVDSQIVAPIINSTQIAANKINLAEPILAGEGGIGIGTSNPLAYFHMVQTTDSVLDVGLMSDVYINKITGSAIILRKARGTVENPLPLQAGDTIGSIKARGYGATGFSSGGLGTGNIRFIASENWTDTSQGEYMQVQLNAKGENTLKERVLINESGIKVTGNATADYFIGDGSLLTGISPGNLFDQNLNTTNNVSFNHLNVTKISIGDADRYLASTGAGDLELVMTTPASSLNIKSGSGSGDSSEIRIASSSVYLTGDWIGLYGGSELWGTSNVYSTSENAFAVADDLAYDQTFRVDTVNREVFAKSLNIINNLTASGTGFFTYLGGLFNRITKLFVQDIDVGNNINVTNNVTANHFIGDGSYLTGISGENLSWNEIYADTKYLTLTSINMSCPAGYLLSGHITNSSGFFNNCSIRDLNYYKKLAAFSGKVGSGNGDEGNFYMGIWNVVPYEVVSDSGNNWNDAEYCYTVPYNGTYSASYSVRTTDNTPASVGYAITLNIEGTGEDNPEFTKWAGVVSNRSSDGKTVLNYHFTEGERLRVLTYQDEPDTYSCSDASFQIELSSLD